MRFGQRDDRLRGRRHRAGTGLSGRIGPRGPNLLGPLVLLLRRVAEGPGQRPLIAIRGRYAITLATCAALPRP